MTPTVEILHEDTFEVSSTSLIVAAAVILFAFVASAIFIKWLRRRRNRP